MDYCQRRGLPVGEKVQKYLEERDEELKKQLEEQEKKKKKAKPKKGEEEPEVNQAEFKFLTKELLIEMLALRMKEEDCNAGVIFDNLESENYPDIKFVVEAICEAVPRQNVQLLTFQFQKEQVEEQEYEVCTNFRYMRRKEELFN
mmetsp:Transcript_8825/g.8179  ORF Transcript_8825/g.8179 Transcript_8825/m.8179 type:complete len:145 (+) Transcript_8825:3026-3460(+)